MCIYLDISQFLKNRFQTGIQRVIKEFLLQALNFNGNIKVIHFNNKAYSHLSNEEVKRFLFDIPNYQLPDDNPIDIFSSLKKNNVFFELDSVWNEEKNLRKQLYQKLKKNNFKIVNFVYDLIPVKFPESIRENTQQNFKPYLNAIVSYSDKVLFDSYSAQKDFYDVVLQKNTREIATNVVHLGSDFTLTNQLQQYKYGFLKQKYILFVGTIEPRKRHDVVLEAFESLQQKYPELCLVFAGSYGWKIDDFKNKIKTHPLKNRKFFHLENVGDEELGVLYNNAFLVTYLSDYEGYGLPLVESLSYGNITITSQNSSLVEVGQEYAEYLKNNNVDQLCEIITSYLENELLYTKRRYNIKKDFNALTWKDFYHNIMRQIDELVN